MTNFLKKMLNFVLDSALMPTGKNLVPTLFFAVCITLLNLVFRLLGWPVKLGLVGCFGAIVVLLLLLVIERSEYSEVYKLCRIAELRIKDIKARQSAGSRNRKNDGAFNVREEHRGSMSGRADNGYEDEDDDYGLNVGDIDGEGAVSGDDKSDR